MRIVLIIAIFSFFSQLCVGQNLVPNPSFEDTVACPIGQNQVGNAVGWINLRSSPDYYNSCATIVSGYSLPNNCDGYQCPANGHAYCGLIPYETGFNNYREFFGIKLLDSLIIGYKYFVSFKASLAEVSICSCNNLGVLFSTSIHPCDTFGIYPLNNFAHVYTNQVITDSVNWTSIYGSFIADSSYKYIVIGNFFDDYNTDTVRFYPVIGCTPYFYIDDVCVSSDSLTCAIPNGNNVCDSTGMNTCYDFDKIKIFPTPTDDKLQIELPLFNNTNILLCDIFGRVIEYFQTSESHISLNLSSYSNGVYVVHIMQNNKRYSTKVTLLKQ